jgi:hypothetical protein
LIWFMDTKKRTWSITTENKVLKQLMVF